MYAPLDPRTKFLSVRSAMSRFLLEIITTVYFPINCNVNFKFQKHCEISTYYLHDHEKKERKKLGNFESETFPISIYCDRNPLFGCKSLITVKAARGLKSPFLPRQWEGRACESSTHGFVKYH